MITIVLEGLDASGKSSMVKRLANDFVCKTMAFPTKPFRALVSEAMDRPERATALLSMDFKYNYPKSGEMWIIDRYFYSTMAYQGAEKRDEWLLPDLALYIKVDVEAAYKRMTEKSLCRCIKFLCHA